MRTVLQATVDALGRYSGALTAQFLRSSGACDRTARWESSAHLEREPLEREPCLL